jgi:hypothetical protein
MSTKVGCTAMFGVTGIAAISAPRSSVTRSVSVGT